ncbi:MAG: ATP-binding protein [Candidatus Binatia bacterium]
MSGAADRLELHIANELHELERVGRALEEFGRAAAVPPPAISAIVLAVDELLTNIIWYAGSSDIFLRVRREADELIAELDDAGKPFDPLQVEPPRLDIPIDERPIGGLGIHLVRQLVDGVSYERVGDRNRLTLRKRI